jgi:hypothetical protein
VHERETWRQVSGEMHKVVLLIGTRTACCMAN